MSKKKLILDESFIDVSRDESPTKISKQIVGINNKDRISLNISSDLKERLQLYSFKNKLNMTFVIEEALCEYFDKRSEA